MDLARPGQLPAEGWVPPCPCTCCLQTIAWGHPYTKVECTAPKEEGILCGVCWQVARAALVAHGALYRERDRQTAPPVAQP